MAQRSFYEDVVVEKQNVHFPPDKCTFSPHLTTQLSQLVIIKGTPWYGQVVARWASKVHAKATPFASRLAVEDALKKAVRHGTQRKLKSSSKGPGPGRDASIRAVQGMGCENYSNFRHYPRSS